MPLEFAQNTKKIKLNTLQEIGLGDFADIVRLQGEI